MPRQEGRTEPSTCVELLPQAALRAGQELQLFLSGPKGRGMEKWSQALKGKCMSIFPTEGMKVLKMRTAAHHSKLRTPILDKSSVFH